MSKYNFYLNTVVDEIRSALGCVDEAQIEFLYNELDKASKIFFVGTGRVRLALECMAKRLTHLGICTFVVGQITEPAIQEGDLLIVGSSSGETKFPVLIAEKAKGFGARVVHIGVEQECAMAKHRDIFVRIPAVASLDHSGGAVSIQPMKSLFEQSLILLGDIVALLIIERKNIKLSTLSQFHANLE